MLNRKNCAVLLSIGLLVNQANAIVIGQMDTFQDGSTNFWGGGATNEIIPDGGPGGIGDKFLRVTSFGGFGTGSNLAINNTNQWAGDYTSSGVRLVETYLKNFSDTTLTIRAVIFRFATRWTSTIGYSLPNDGQWHLARFWIRESDMTRVLGTDPFNTVAAGAARLMIRHNEDPPTEGGTPIEAQMGFDNIVASAGRRVSGTVVFSNLESGVTPPSSALEFRNVGTTQQIYGGSSSFDSTGNFTIFAPPVPGVYDLSIKPSHWLRRTVTIDTTSGDSSNGALTCINGDVVDDNEINLVDFGAMSAAFGTDSSSGNWNPNADLDGDGEVTLVDYGVLSANFGQAGDE